MTSVSQASRRRRRSHYRLGTGAVLECFSMIEGVARLSLIVCHTMSYIESVGGCRYLSPYKGCPAPCGHIIESVSQWSYYNLPMQSNWGPAIAPVLYLLNKYSKRCRCSPMTAAAKPLLPTEPSATAAAPWAPVTAACAGLGRRKVCSSGCCPRQAPDSCEDGLAQHARRRGAAPRVCRPVFCIS
jgi:hypothetical protein